MTFPPQTDPVAEWYSGLDHGGEGHEQEAIFGGRDRASAMLSGCPSPSSDLVGFLVRDMWNEPSEDELKKLPRLYASEDVGWRDKIIHQHYFIFGCDWYMAEYSSEERIFFGCAILNDDLDNSEWGSISFDELREVRVRGIEVDRDLHWKSRRAGDVEKIVEAYRGRGI